MPKLRKAALVATMVGSVSMLGAGVASAQGDGGQPPATTVTCNQTNGDTTTSEVGGLITVNGPLLSVADSRAQQNICGIDNDGNVNGSGDASGGGGNGLI
ncbi:hypothetical protein GCM10012287_52330 [Streptomyces daqingensis]|uniref:Secreted protein n=1 Tax=Streptomyces daqingensis TaxID=1472640 RepID=A0ABQ2MR02_9ACTN|nr:hypothetical protein [Streptomyces daqingensis]GGO57140.1 hypothetical protein GCM10012287_52330 [Streptomyces daqingensis]